MSKDVGMTVNSAEVEEMFSFFTSEQAEDLYKRALGSVAAQYKETVKTSFQNELPAATRHSQSGYKDRLIDAVRVSKVQSDSEGVKTKVHIMGVKSSGSGTYRAHFFEGGTEPRETKREYTDSLGRTYKKGKPLGRIKALNYFQKAQSVMSNLTVSLDKVINDLIAKNAPK